jgi:hypothetical protein
MLIGTLFPGENGFLTARVYHLPHHRGVYGVPVHIILRELHPVRRHMGANITKQLKDSNLEVLGKERRIIPMFPPQGLYQVRRFDRAEFEMGSLFQSKERS